MSTTKPAGKINDMNRVRVDGILYEWNDIFQVYWSVRGDLRTLQERDLENADVAQG